MIETDNLQDKIFIVSRCTKNIVPSDLPGYTSNVKGLFMSSDQASSGTTVPLYTESRTVMSCHIMLCHIMLYYVNHVTSCYMISDQITLSSLRLRLDIDLL